MISLKSNQLLLWFVGLNAAYWTFGWFPDGIWLSAFFSGFLVVSGSMLASTSVPEAFAIMKKGEIGAGELAVVSIAGISFGLTYTGIFGLLFYYAGRPDAWIGPFSSYGRAWVDACMFLLFLSPEATRQGIKRPQWWVVVLAVILIALMAFLFGLNFQADRSLVSTVDMTSIPRSWIPRFIRLA